MNYEIRYTVALAAALILALVASPSHATGNSNNGTDINVNNVAGAAASAVSRAQQQQGQVQGQLQGQVAGGGEGGGGGSVFGSKFPHQAPSFGLASMFPTAVCQGTLAGGFSFLLGGGAAAGTVTIQECMKIETIRVGVYMMQHAVTSDHILAMQKANTEVYCKLEHAKDTSICPKIPQEDTVATDSENKPAKLGDMLPPWNKGS